MTANHQPPAVLPSQHGIRTLAISLAVCGAALLPFTALLGKIMWMILSDGAKWLLDPATLFVVALFILCGGGTFLIFRAALRLLALSYRKLPILTFTDKGVEIRPDLSKSQTHLLLWDQVDGVEEYRTLTSGPLRTRIMLTNSGFDSLRTGLNPLQKLSNRLTSKKSVQYRTSFVETSDQTLSETILKAAKTAGLNVRPLREATLLSPFLTWKFEPADPKIQR